MTIPVVTVGQSGGDLVGGLERLHRDIIVVRRCEELADLLAACQSGLARAAVIAGGSGELTATLVDRLAAVGVAVVAVAGDHDEAQRLRAIGAYVAGPDADSAELARNIAEAVEGLTGVGFSADGVRASSLSDPAASLNPTVPPVQETQEVEGDARIIAVWGPLGSPGRTLVAVNMAAELAADGQSVLLVDADSYGASVAAVLGMLDESAGLAQACRAADQGQLDLDTLRRIATPVFLKSGTLRVLSGITRADRWTELRAPALTMVLEKAKAIADVVIVDTGFSLEADEELSFDTLAPRRNAATLRVLELADTLYAIGSADPIGIPRLVRALAELETSVPHASPTVILNKVRVGTVGRSPQAQLREAWERYGPAVDIAGFLPADLDACDASLLTGSVLSEVAPTSPLRHAIAQIVCANVQQNRKSHVRSARARRRLKR